MTILLALGGAFFGIIFAMIFALVKINRVRILYPIQACFCQFFTRDSFVGSADVDLLWDSSYFKSDQSVIMEQLLILMLFQLSCLQLWLFAFNEAAYASETIRAAILSVDPGEIEAARSLGMTNASSLSSDYYSQCSSGCNSNLNQLSHWLDQGDFASL